MKALIRNYGETITEADRLDIDWDTGYPLTDESWNGGPYKLIENYSPSEIEPEISGDSSNI